MTRQLYLVSLIAPKFYILSDLVLFSFMINPEVQVKNPLTSKTKNQQHIKPSIVEPCAVALVSFPRELFSG